MKRTRAMIAGLPGLLFGIGLLLSGMANPQKVLGFFDLHRWDPSLALVMVGAIGVGLPGFALARHLGKTWLGEPLRLPGTQHLDSRLLIGAALFGLGWGLAGICPGPALVLLGAGEFKGILFVLSMLCGMMVFEKFAAAPPARN